MKIQDLENKLKIASADCRFAANYALKLHNLVKKKLDADKAYENALSKYRNVLEPNEEVKEIIYQYSK